MSYRVTADVGGTFTDLVVTDEHGGLYLGKATTTPDRAFTGVRDALRVVAGDLGTDVGSLLGACDLFVYSTTRATNAVVEHASGAG